MTKSFLAYRLVDYSLIIGNNQWLINWLPIDYLLMSLITHWFHWCHWCHRLVMSGHVVLEWAFKNAFKKNHFKSFHLQTNYRSSKCMQTMYPRLSPSFLWLTENHQLLIIMFPTQNCRENRDICQQTFETSSKFAHVRRFFSLDIWIFFFLPVLPAFEGKQVCDSEVAIWLHQYIPVTRGNSVQWYWLGVRQGDLSAACGWR